MFFINDSNIDGYIGYAFKTPEDAEKFISYLCTIGYEEEYLSVENLLLIEDVESLIEEVKINMGMVK